MFQNILPSERKGDIWTPWCSNTEKDFPSERFCFLVATKSSDQFCLSLVPTERVENEYRRIKIRGCWCLGNVDITVKDLSSFRRIARI
jgi:hypothetical protein